MKYSISLIGRREHGIQCMHTSSHKSDDAIDILWIATMELPISVLSSRQNDVWMTDLDINMNS